MDISCPPSGVVWLLTQMRVWQVNVHREWRDGMSFHFCDKIRSGSNWRMKYRGGDRRRNTHTHTNTRFVKARHSALNDVINTEQTDPILISLTIYWPESRPVSTAHPVSSVQGTTKLATFVTTIYIFL